MNRGRSRFRPRTHCVWAPTMYESGWEAVTSHLGEITNLPLSKAIEIQHIGFAWQGYAIVISISQILVSGGYCNFPASFKFCRVHVYRANSIRIPFVFYFFGRDPFSIGITFYIHHFLYILSKAQHPLYINMVYKWHDLRFIRLYPFNLDFQIF